ncbi:MAG TPA: lipase family protein [Pyrinomonadaceae bacterium]|jgi:hypothetical protein
MTPDEIKRLLPPNLDYLYFERAAAFPFQPAATDFQLVNAGWLMDLSLLAYAQDTDFIRRELKKIGLHKEPLFLGFNLQKRSTQCFVVHNDEVIITVFRGTEVHLIERVQNIVADVLTDARIVQVPSAFKGGVHGGFAKALDEVWAEAANFLRSIKEQQAVWFTGHSLGAALATLAAERYSRSIGDVQALYTFGSPRVGDEEFAENFRPRAFRIVNGRDIVTTVPILAPASTSFPFPLRAYKHLGELKYINRAGQLTNQDPRPMTEVMSLLRAATSNRLAEEFVQPLVDHAPLLYSERLWQNL